VTKVVLLSLLFVGQIKNIQFWSGCFHTKCSTYAYHIAITNQRDVFPLHYTCYTPNHLM